MSRSARAALLALELPLRLAQPLGGRLGLGLRGRSPPRRRAASRRPPAASAARPAPARDASARATAARAAARPLRPGRPAPAGSAAAARRRPAAARSRGGALPLGFLLLPARQLAQLLRQRVDLLVGLLLVGALRGLVLVGHLVELELEQVGEVVRRSNPRRRLRRHPAGGWSAPESRTLLRPSADAAAPAAPAATRSSGFCACSCRFGGAHLLGRLRQNLGDPLERRVGLDQPAVHAAHQALHLLPQPRLRQREQHEVLAELRRRIRLPVADDVEGGRDDLPLLLRQRADLGTAARRRPRRRRPATAPRGSRWLNGRICTKYRSLVRACAPGRRRCRSPARSRRRSRPACSSSSSRKNVWPAVISLVGGVAAAKSLIVCSGPPLTEYDQIQRPHAEVVVGARLDEELFDGARRRVAAGLGERHRRAADR